MALQQFEGGTHVNKWIQKGTATLMAAALLIGQAVSAGAAGVLAKQEESLKIASLSDTHYLSPTLIKDTEDFTEHLNSDRKMFAESEAFLNALLDTVKQDDPDVLLISGDLTKDGEKEGHVALAGILEKFEEETGAEVYITPGNHDLNNSNAMNFNTADGVAVQAGRTTQEDYKTIYADLVYKDDSVIATFTPAEGKQGGGLSYVARPKDGFTIISIDSARYSADNTESGTDEHETSGNVGPELEAWVVGQIKAAKQRGDTVIGLQHHGMVPHFSMEPDLLPIYLVNDYERLAQVYADAGMSYIFTGHMHANDIAAVTTEAGNTLYDIETGSVVTYPSPARAVTLTRTIENGTVKESMDVKTYTGVVVDSMDHPIYGEDYEIGDITEYGRKHGFSNAMLTTTVNGFLHPYYAQILQAGGSKKAIEALINDLLGDSLPIKDITLEKLIDVGLPLLLPDAGSEEAIFYDTNKAGIAVDYPILGSIGINVLIPNQGLKDTLNILFKKLDKEVLAHPEVIDNELKTIIEALTGIKVYGTDTADDTSDDKTLLDYANYIYQSHLGGEDSGEQPAWVTAATGKIESGELLSEVLKELLKGISLLLKDVLANVTFEELVGSEVWDQINKVFIPATEGRTPLLRPYDPEDSTGGNIPTVLGILGAKWQSVVENGKIVKYIPKESSISNKDVGYSVYDFLMALKTRLKFESVESFIEELLTGLLLGTPADPEEGTPAEEGLINAELKSQLNGWLLNLVNSMGTDSNYPEDNDTTITNEWKLLTDRTALDKAIAGAEALDLTPYTAQTAKAVTDALAAAKALPLTATQAEMDAAAKALNDAVAALETKPGSTTDTEKPGDNNTGTEKPDGGNTQAPGNDQSDTPADVPQTGDTAPVFPLLLLALSAGGIALTVCYKSRTVHR